MNDEGVHRFAVLFLAAVAAAGSSLWAQRDAAPAAQRAADTTLADWLVDKDARVSALIGRRVVSPSGKDLGEVEDLLAIAGRDQRPVVVLSIGSVLDVGDKWHAASLDQLRIAPDNERLLLDKTDAELEAAPSFDYVPTIGARSERGVGGPDRTSSVGCLLGATVVDDAGDSIGEIKDFVVSTGAQGTRAVVGLDEETGAVRGRLVAVPFAALHIERSGEEPRAAPQQARVRVELGGKHIETLPAYQYPERQAI